jgi:glycosyltransferase involved in cell wall biosynthesis
MIAAMRKLRILYHHRTQGRGAEGNHIVSIVTALRDAGHHVDVVSPPGVDPFSATSTLPVDTVRAPPSGWAALWRSLSLHLPGWLFEVAECVYNVPAWLRLRRTLREGRYDLVFERYASYLIAGAIAARGAGCRFVLEVNDVSGVADRVRKQHFPRACAAVERRLLARCDVVHVVSSYLGECVRAIGVPAERIVVAPNGFDVGRIRLNRSRDEVRRTLGLDDGLVVGFAGWFVPWDRLDFMADAFAAVAGRVPGLKLCLVGDGEPARELVARFAGTPLEHSIVLTGAVPRDQVYDYIQTFDIGFLPHSNLFGSPVVMFEMMGLNVPLLAPALPPIRDVHEHGDTALLFTPLDLAECVANLERLATSADLRRDLAQRAGARLATAHTWRHTAERILAALPMNGGTAAESLVEREARS